MNWIKEAFSGLLARKIGLIVFFASIIITVLTSAIFLGLRLQSDLADIEVHLEEARNSHLASIGSRIWVEDIASLKLDLSGMLELRSIEYLSVTEDGELIAEAGVMPSIGGIQLESPILYEYKGNQLNIGRLNIVASTADVNREFYDSAFSAIILIALQTFMIAGLVLLLFNIYVTQHLRRISKFARHIELTNINEKLDLKRRNGKGKTPDELDVLVNSLTSMQSQLSESVISLKESEENLSLTLDCIGDAVIATDQAGLVTRMNPIAESLTGWTFSEAQGNPIDTVFSIVNAQTRARIKNPIYKALSTGKIITLSNNTTLLAKDNKEHQVADSAAPIRNNLGDIIGGIIVFHDVSEQYSMRQTLRENEKRIKLHFSHTPLGVIEWDKDFVVTDWNPAAEKIFGYSDREAVGRSYMELIVPPSENKNAATSWKSFISNKASGQAVRENKAKDGRTVVCEWYNTPLVDECGELIGAASLVQDISARIAGEKTLARHQKEQEQLLNNMLDAVISFDKKGTILSINKAAEKLFSYTTEEILGADIGNLVPNKSLKKYNELLTKAQENEGGHSGAQPQEMSVINKDGLAIPVRFSIATLPQIDNTNQRFIASVHDLTFEKQKEEQLRHSQKMDALGKLTGGIAHDYNNMLGIILGFTELLGMKLHDDQKLLGYVENIEQAGERGVELTKKLLSFSKHQPSEAHAVNINAILRNQRPMLEKILTARITLLMNLSENLWDTWVDSGDFSDALVNLCINAMHAMESTGTLAIETCNESLDNISAIPAGLEPGDYVSLRVTDTGKGMDSDTILHIFDPFFTTKGNAGTGLGLSQVYGFVERSGGAVKVESTLAQGSSFQFYFPRHFGRSGTKKHAEIEGIKSTKGSESILVVDDEESLLDLVKEVLGAQGYNVFEARSAKVALEVLRSEHIDLVLSDVVMPDLDGNELSKIVKKEFPNSKIQLMSGFNESRYAENYDVELHEKLIIKPFRAQILLRRIRQLLGDK